MVAALGLKCSEPCPTRRESAARVVRGLLPWDQPSQCCLCTLESQVWFPPQGALEGGS